MRLDELSFEIRLERRTTKAGSFERIMRLMSVFILDAPRDINIDFNFI